MGVAIWTSLSRGSSLDRRDGIFSTPVAKFTARKRVIDLLVHLILCEKLRYF